MAKARWDRPPVDASIPMDILRELADELLTNYEAEGRSVYPEVRMHNDAAKSGVYALIAKATFYAELHAGPKVGVTAHDLHEQETELWRFNANARMLSTPKNGRSIWRYK